MKKIIILSFFTIALVGPIIANAQGFDAAGADARAQGGVPSGESGGRPSGESGGVPADDELPTLPNPLKVGSIPELIGKIIDLLIEIGYVVVAFFLLLSGFKFVAAQGSEDKLNDAKRTFYYTIIGALLVIGARTIYAVVENVVKSLS